MGRHRLCDYCRLQGLRPSPFFSTRRLRRLRHDMKTAGYTEACAPSLAASSIFDKNKEWHANVPDRSGLRKERERLNIHYHSSTRCASPEMRMSRASHARDY